MARWKLTQPHYLQVEGTEWEYKELNRSTGKQVRKVFQVPLYLNPEDPADWNYPHDEAIIVSNGVNPSLRDHVFTGPPTPDMEPLDDEARAISDAERHNWIVPEHAGDSNGMAYSQSLIKAFEQQMAKLGPIEPAPASNEVAKLKAQVAELKDALAQFIGPKPNIQHSDTVATSSIQRRM